MTLEEFETNDRFCTLSTSDICCHGSAKNAVAWLLDPDNSTSFDAVLDPDDMQVATLDDDGDVVWEPLADFEA